MTQGPAGAIRSNHWARLEPSGGTLAFSEVTRIVAVRGSWGGDSAEWFTMITGNL